MITNKNLFLAFLTICLGIGLESCSTSENEVIELAKYTINGKIEKGPFVNGSSIDLQPMDAKMNALGSTYSATILDNAGNFSFGSKEIESPYVTFTANGYFYNEVEGELSNGPLTLKAIVNLADKSTVNVNLLTHLKYQRILNLISTGKSFNKANTQAQKEILTAFGLQKYKDTDVSQYSIVTGTDEAGALIAISSLLLTYRSEAEFTEYLAKISNEFAQNGTFSENTINQMRTDRKKLKLSTINEHLISRYKELGVPISVKDLKYYFDWNNDGIAGNEFASDDVELEVSEINVPQEGGSYRININTSMEVMLTKDDSEDLPFNYSSDLYYNPILHKESIEDHILKVEIQPTKYRSTKPLEINIYNYVGEIVATLTVKQAGNPLGGILTNTGSNVISSIGESLSEAINSYNTLDAKYTQLILDNSFKAPLSSNNSDLCESWGFFYKAINRIIPISEVDQEQGGYIQAPLNTLFSFCFYDMIIFWNDVVYFEKPLTPFGSEIRRTDANIIFTKLETKLKESIESLENKKNTVATNAEDFIFFSKDVPRILLANIYMYQNKYNEAKALLQNVVSNGYYQLESEKVYTASSKELIFGLFKDDVKNGLILPVLTYSDVLLLLSECEYKLGNMDSAKELLNQVTDKKGIVVSSDLLMGIKEARKYVISNNGGYFSFLKRNNLAISELELEKYQLLFPIPGAEIGASPNITQNPGY